MLQPSQISKNLSRKKHLITVVLTIDAYNYFLIRPAINHLRFDFKDVEMLRLFYILNALLSFLIENNLLFSE